MPEPLLFGLHDGKALTDGLCRALSATAGRLESRHFPDGESYFRILDDVKGRRIILLADLHQPDQRALGVLLLADTLRDLQAQSVMLVAPYLPYMRQDRRFHAGEGLTSEYFGRILSEHIDALVTVDPHLHRYAALDEIYSVPSMAMHAADDVARWITANIENPALIGPDSESEQWVAAVSAIAGAPYTVLEKVRHGDRRVEVSVPDVERWRGHTPVLVDDIISSGHTMLETLGHLERLGLQKAVCIGVHAVFADDAAARLSAAARRVVTTNTIPHATNAIGVTGLLARGITALWEST